MNDDQKNRIRIEKTMKSERIYDGKIVNLRVDTVEMPGKMYSKREIVEHLNGVAIIPIDEDGKVYMVRQFRKAVEQVVLELPAGLMEVGEEPRETALRELQEEIGYGSTNLEYLFDAYASPGFSTEKVSFFLAKDLYPSKLEEDEGEFLEVDSFTLEELKTMLDNCEVTDMKTVIGILYLLGHQS